MKNKTCVIMASIALLAAACGEKSSEEARIGKSQIKVENGLMTPEVLWAFGRLGDLNVSADGTKIAYGVQYYSVEENKSNREIFVMNADGTENKQITSSAKSEYAAKWVKNDKKIAFLFDGQIWEMNPDGSGRKQISDIENGISDFLYSPDNQKILFISDVKYGERTVDKYPDLPKASGRIVNDLMYKHWDEWVESVPHPFVADFDGKKLTNIVDILDGEPYECPMKPFGGIEQLAWSPDSKTIAYTCRKKTGKEYAISTNSDIYLFNVDNCRDAQPCVSTNLTEGMMGYDINPAFSPDGKFLAFQSMARDGNESDKNRLMVYNFETKEFADLTQNFDQSVESFIWGGSARHSALDAESTANEEIAGQAPTSRDKLRNDGGDGWTIYFTSVWHGETHIYKIARHSDASQNPLNKVAGQAHNDGDFILTQITNGQYDYEQIALAGKGLIATRHSMQMPNEIYAINESSGEATQVSFENKHILDQLKIADVKPRWTKTTDGKDMLSWVIFPPDFDPAKKYPTLLFCEGGPQSPVSQFWSYRWNFQIMAAHGYIIIAPNRRGLYGFGQEWLEQISGDYGGQNMKDYLSAIDDIAKEPYVDADRLGCVGASYGGFSVYWLAGHHNKRFKAFIAHDGMFNLEQQYLETEEMWFVNWDLGGAYWEKDNATAQKSFYQFSPHLFIDKWDTPILVIHGEKDYRILASQGMAAFNAAVLRGVPAEMLIFPDENHWVLKPQNGILWQRTYFEWLDRWLKKKQDS
ncbi:MAG: S9 family peptidase [Candidatus Symbiothrix sp.]|jgi:dipeptidyl aminopeptidase/acylaminoacyl peptidase|nr:S9 family peptidase [Candidatus Symbiothrix sp.]